MKKLKLFSAAVAFSFGMHATAQAPYTLPKLGYAYNALQPGIDAQTMEIHYTKHHQAYVDNLNKALKGTNLEGLTLEQLLLNAGKRSEAIRNNAGGHYNHSLFWEVLTPNTETNTKPSDALMKSIEYSFKNMDSLKKAMNQAASTRFGSGWAWLIVTPDKRLVVTSTPNQDNPIMDVSKDHGIPIIGIDVWEHAYYLKYQNKRADYLAAIWDLLNWDVISKKYYEALQGPLLTTIEKSSWKALSDFHMVMAQTFHPAEDNNLKPIRERSGELLARAVDLKNSTIPASFDTPEIRKAIDELVKGASELDKANTKKAKDAALKEKLNKLHDKFHEIQGLCSH